MFDVFSPKWLHVEGRGLALNTFVSDPEPSAVGKPPCLLDFLPVPIFSISTFHHLLLVYNSSLLAKCSLLASLFQPKLERFDLRNIKTYLRGKLDQENVNDQLSRITQRCIVTA